jgi:hypothetical protein
MKRVLLSLAVILVGCADRPLSITEPPLTPATIPAVDAATVGHCHADADCRGGYCRRLDYYPPADDPDPLAGVCERAATDGSNCSRAAQCRSGVCLDLRCSGCRGASERCTDDDQCCTGSCPVIYGPRTCEAPLAEGAFCGSDRACKSGHCVDYRCAP